ncbi:MAG: hypothetical protein IKR48_04750 [Kiritimatiellae bacterium]|nr:hypothetical protein [Kiritimatiellia bacterium]
MSTSVSANGYSYSYDSVGNFILASRNAATNYYLSNALNQYSSIFTPPHEISLITAQSASA